MCSRSAFKNLSRVVLWISKTCFNVSKILTVFFFFGFAESINLNLGRYLTKRQGQQDNNIKNDKN